MSWGTDVNVDIFINRMKFNSIEEVNYAIEEAEKEIDACKAKLYMYSISSINDIVPEEWVDDKIMWIKVQIDELLEWIEENTILILKLELLKENFDKRVLDE